MWHDQAFCAVCKLTVDWFIRVVWQIKPFVQYVRWLIGLVV